MKNSRSSADRRPSGAELYSWKPPKGVYNLGQDLGIRASGAQDEPRTYNPGVAKQSKGAKIGEVCKIADVQPYVLRHWESEFEQLAPKKSGGGQRLYSDDEVAIILRIKELLYGEGFTIPGAKKKLGTEVRDGRLVPVEEPASENNDSASRLLRETRAELEELLRILG